SACIRRGGAPPTEAGRCELLLLWEGRPRRDALALLAGSRLRSPRGRASHKGGAVRALLCGRADLGATLWLCWQAGACIRREGAPPTKAGRCELLLLWEGRPRRDALALLAGWRLHSPRGRASHK